MAGAKILVAEDDEEMGAYIQKCLERAGFSVVAVVTTAEQAVAAAKNSTPDLVLMEITLPGNMDGVDAAGQIRSQLNIPLVYLARSADQKTQERANVTKPAGYLRKPFNGKPGTSSRADASRLCWEHGTPTDCPTTPPPDCRAAPADG